MAQSTRVIIKNESDITEATDVAAERARAAGFSKVEVASIASSVSEIVTNALKHAGGGECSVREIDKGIEIVVKDGGLGIPDIALAMQAGYSSIPKSLGLGLKAAKRAMDVFDIQTEVGRGTTVTLRKYCAIAYEEIEYGVISLPKSGETKNGDQYVIKEYEGDKALLAVIDGEGHGPNAYESGVLVQDVVEKNYNLPLREIVERAHEALGNQKGRNAVLAIFRLTADASEYIGVGDTEVMVIPEGGHALFSHPGQLGLHNFPASVKVQTSAQPLEVVVILHSDGIQRRFSADDLPLSHSAQAIADFIMRNFRRETDDATVLVAKRKK